MAAEPAPARGERDTHIGRRERPRQLTHGALAEQRVARYWPTAGDDPAAPAYVVDFAGIWNAKPKVVFSNTLERGTPYFPPLERRLELELIDTRRFGSLAYRLVKD